MLLLACFVAGSSPAMGNVHLELRVSQNVAELAEFVGVDLYAVSDDQTDQPFVGLDAVLRWDTATLRLVGFAPDVSPFSWPRSNFPNDEPLDRLNADCGPDTFCIPYTGLPYNDGNAFYQAAALSPDSPPMATPDGLLIVRLVFETIIPISITDVGFHDRFGLYSSSKVVASGPNGTAVVTGELRSVSFGIAACGTRGDFSGNCRVELTDYQEFEPCIGGPNVTEGAVPCEPGDLDGDDDTDLYDVRLLQLIFTGQ